jgi:hypothetical protein
LIVTSESDLCGCGDSSDVRFHVMRGGSRRRRQQPAALA